MCMKIKSATRMREKKVMVSAPLAMALLHGVFVMNNIADMSVPACAMPTQKTKFTR